MQVQGTDSLVSYSSSYSSPLDCAVKTAKTEGVRKWSLCLQLRYLICFQADLMHLQLTGIFRGGHATLLRESLGNASFFTTYEYVRYYLHLQMKDSSPDWTHLIDVGIGIMSGGLGGIAVSILIT